MILQQPDGFPVTFTLLDAAALTGEGISTLRNNIARGILQHVGQIPLAGQERRFTVTGLLEIAIINALTESLPLQKASGFADRFLRSEYVDACGDGRITREAGRAPTLSEIVEMVSIAESSDTTIFDCAPHKWMRGPKWEDRDVTNPWLVMFLVTEQAGGLHFHMRAVHGWQGLGDIAVDLTRHALPVLLNSVTRGQRGPTMDELLPTAEVAMLHYPHLHLLNLTSLLVRIDRAIEQKQ